jgi:hypothetical protein
MSSPAGGESHRRPPAAVGTIVVMNTATSVVIGIAVLAWIVLGQLRTREVRTERGLRAMVVIGLVGLWESLQFVDAHAVAPVAVVLMTVSLLMSAGLGVLRGALQPVWRDRDGRVWRRGNGGTVGLWLIAISLHLAWDLVIRDVDVRAAGLGTASLLLYLAISLGAQAATIRVRATRLSAPACEPTYAA